MRPRAAPVSLVAAALGLAGCHHGADGPGTVTADEQRQLNEAAAALDADARPANAAAPDDDSDGDNSTDDPS